MAVNHFVAGSIPASTACRWQKAVKRYALRVAAYITDNDALVCAIEPDKFDVLSSILRLSTVRLLIGLYIGEYAVG